MKAALCTRFNAPLEITELMLAPPRRGEVEVTLAACAICHSDLHFIEGAWGGALPAVYGHEAAGFVSALGEGGSAYRIGQRVLVTLIRACGTCACCSDGRPMLCETAGTAASPLSLPDGTPVTQGMNTAGFAEKVVVDSSQLAPLPEDIPLDVAALLACGVITGVGAVFNTAAMPAGASAVVIGTGGVGLNTIQGARIAGARRIIALDVAPEKLHAAREFGATDGVLATAPDARAQVLALTGGRGAEYVFVTVGAVMAYEQALGLTAPGGTIIMAGMTGNEDYMRLNPMMVAYQEQRLIGSKMGGTVLRRDIPRLIDLYRQGRLRLDELISNRYPLARINEAIADTAKGGTRRNVIVFDSFGQGAP
ncbi:Zn-dependent alcohol dehydrogenase [Natronohydrobacter thiooxidans]|uniref:Zn-dependent alcohol dehydrogenase n=1 Tax=Natronohydrobacter thiooxidans TaxID=87172 RepID=UPI0008FF3DAF|nr:Zn-dependent alcohol dehydrogenase [Natronohydrobacter thiooxidans]